MKKFLPLLCVILLNFKILATPKPEKFQLSIITSIYKGEIFIESFLENITKAPNFNEYELILINANSPENEEEIIKNYLDKHPNIIYKKLDHDPGLYEVWNMGIKMASSEFITNCNLDDRSNLELFEPQITFLKQHPEIDLIYSDYLITEVPNQTFKNNTHKWHTEIQEFTKETLYLTLPGPQPMWQKSMHEKYGYFRSDFKSAGDLEMWNRAALKGAQFKKFDGISTLIYNNPDGLSTSKNPEKQKIKKNEESFITGAYKSMWDQAPESPRLLILIPTKSRPEKFFKQLNNYYKKLSGQVNYHFLINCAQDDKTMNNSEVIYKLEQYPNLTYKFNNTSSKIEAYNANLQDQDFDILLAVANDMEPQLHGFDKIIIDKMQENFPDFDGLLNFHDGSSGANRCSTLPIIGKKFFERFNYLFNPEYKSLFANLELTLIARILGKEYVSNDIIIKHMHPVWNLGEWDNLYYINESFKNRDQEIFNKRHLRNFDLEENSEKIWSILIPTIEERKEIFENLYKNLTEQITQENLQDKIEIIYLKDKKGEASIGKKRNKLIQKSKGKYFNFIDDDDRVHENYIKIIYEKLLKDPDCVELKGIITTDGKTPIPFFHSIDFDWETKNGIYLRPPNHLNPIKRIIGAQFLFPENSFGEDYDWCMQISNSGLLKKETKVEEFYYFYDYSTDKTSIEQNATQNLLYICTASNAEYFPILLNLIGGIHMHNFDNLEEIAVANLGLTNEQINKLNQIEKVYVLEIEKTNPEILKNFQVTDWGKVIPGWYSWKPVAIKQALEKYPYVLWLDASMIILKPLNPLFEHINREGYFLITIESGEKNSPHAIGPTTTKTVFEHFHLDMPGLKWILEEEQITPCLLGAKRESNDLFVDKWYDLTKNIKLFEDDGSAPNGFGGARYEQTLLSIIGYINHLTLYHPDHLQKEPIQLNTKNESSKFYFTHINNIVDENTNIHHARGKSLNYNHHEKIRYKNS